MKIIVKADCGNAPKKEQLRDLIIALANRSYNSTQRYLVESFRWNIIGNQVYKDLESIFNILITPKPKQLLIENILSHGNLASINGCIEFEDNTVSYFSHFALFNGHTKSAKIKEITSYIINDKN